MRIIWQCTISAPHGNLRHSCSGGTSCAEAAPEMNGFCNAARQRILRIDPADAPGSRPARRMP